MKRMGIGLSVGLLVTTLALPMYCADQTAEFLQVKAAKVQYLSGGGLRSEPAASWKNDLPSWKDRLTVTPERIELRLRDGRVVQIEPARVTALTYAGIRRRRDEVIALAVVTTGLAGGLAATAAAPKSASHLIEIDFTLADGPAAAILLRAHKSNYEAILTALRTVTGIAEETQPRSGRGDHK